MYYYKLHHTSFRTEDHNNNCSSYIQYFDNIAVTRTWQSCAVFSFMSTTRWLIDVKNWAKIRPHEQTWQNQVHDGGRGSWCVSVVDVYDSRNGNGCLSHRFYRRSSYTHPYLRDKKHHHLLKKQSGLRTCMLGVEVWHRIYRRNWATYRNRQALQPVFSNTRNQKTADEDTKSLRFCC